MGWCFPNRSLSLGYHWALPPVAMWETRANGRRSHRRRLSFWLHVDTAETTTTGKPDKLTVSLGATKLATFSNLNHRAGYTRHAFNVAAFAGGTEDLVFDGNENGSRQTSFVIDDTALRVR